MTREEFMADIRAGIPDVLPEPMPSLTASDNSHC